MDTIWAIQAHSHPQYSLGFSWNKLALFALQPYTTLKLHLTVPNLEATAFLIYELYYACRCCLWWLSSC